MKVNPKDQDNKSIQVDVQELKQALEQYDSVRYKQLFSAESDIHDSANSIVALQLIRRLIRREAMLSYAEQEARIEAACKLIRIERGIPIFMVRPRKAFSRDWQVSVEGFTYYHWLHESLLPALQQEWKRLPPGQWNGTEPVEFGRLIVILIVRLAVLNAAQLDALLRLLVSGTPILATGSARYLSFSFICRRTAEPMRRTVYFDPLTMSYVLLERKSIIRNLGSWLSLPRYRRQRHMAKALRAYLQSLGVGSPQLTVHRLCEAVRQEVMLEGTPVLAAYAAGEIHTEDLDDRQLRRLAGYAIRTRTNPQAGKVVTPEADDEILEETLEGLRSDPLRLDLPDDLRKPDANIIRRIVATASPYIDQLHKDIMKMDVDPNIGELLKAYALWLLRDWERVNPQGRKLPSRDKKLWQWRVCIVGYSILLDGSFNQSEMIDDQVLDRWSEISTEHFRQRLCSSAWFQFRRFLRDSTGHPKGIQVAEISEGRESSVSAIVFSEKEIDSALSTLGSIYSGLSNSKLRQSAVRLVQIAAATGCRRAEIEHLRPSDIQEDLIRIQPHADHRLKTESSCRVIPMAFLPEAVRSQLQGDFGSKKRVIQITAQGVNGYQLFNQINKVLKQVSCEPSAGLHHFRHTMASRLFLDMHRQSLNLQLIKAEFPWLNDWAMSEQQLQVLMGSEGEEGQGLQIISTLLGHLHPTTTLRHYIHTCGIALFALNRSRFRDESIAATFEDRIESRRTAQGWARAAKLKSVNHAGSDAMERANRYVWSRVESMEREGLNIDETPLEKPRIAIAEDAGIEVKRTGGDLLRMIESIESSLRNTQNQAQDDLLIKVKSTFASMAVMQSGRKVRAGITPPSRHKLEFVKDVGWLPESFRGKGANSAAIIVLDWLAQVQVRSPDDYQWLLGCWVNRSERSRGWMRLKSKEELLRCRQIPKVKKLSVQFSGPGFTKLHGIHSKHYFRIRVKANSPYDRDVSGIRWAMAWTAALL